MKEKIFLKLKTKYSSLGLGDEILLAHAEMLAKMGFVTDDNYILWRWNELAQLRQLIYVE